MIPKIKKYAKYIGIVAAGVVIILGYVLITSWFKKKRTGDEGMSEGTEELEHIIDGLGKDMDEANTQSQIEIAVARGNEKVTKEELRAVTSNPDKLERRKRLAEMYGRIK